MLQADAEVNRVEPAVDGDHDEPPAVPTVGAVVVNFNGGERVLRVVEALLRQHYELAEIVVVDNASSDGSTERISASYPTVRVIRLPANEGLPRARNVGLRALGTALALSVDHDVYPEPDCVQSMVRAYLAERPTVVCPRIRLIPDRDVVQADGAAPHFVGTLVLRNEHRSVQEAPVRSMDVNGCIGACMLMERGRVLAAGGFDESFFFYFEDLEFSLRLRGMGLRIWCEPTAVTFHEPAAGTIGLSFRGRGGYPARRAYFTMRNRLQVVLVHYRWRTLLLLSPVLVLYEMATLAAAFRRGWPMQWLRAWGWQFGHARSLMSRRRGVQRQRRVADRHLLEGGRPPLAQGFISSPAEERLVRVFSAALNGYWSVVWRWIG